MRNGDFLPSRIQAQQDAVGVICHAKTRQNPENNIALLTLARYVREGSQIDFGAYCLVRQNSEICLSHLDQQ